HRVDGSTTACAYDTIAAVLIRDARERHHDRRVVLRAPRKRTLGAAVLNHSLHQRTEEWMRRPKDERRAQKTRRWSESRWKCTRRMRRIRKVDSMSRGGHRSPRRIEQRF